MSLVPDDDPQSSRIAALLRASAMARFAMDAGAASLLLHATSDEAAGIEQALQRVGAQAGRPMPRVACAGVQEEVDLVVVTQAGAPGEEAGWCQRLTDVLARARHGAVVEMAILPKEREQNRGAFARLARRFGISSSAAHHLPSRQVFGDFAGELGWRVEANQLLRSSGSQDVCIFRLAASSARTEAPERTG